MLFRFSSNTEKLLLNTTLMQQQSRVAKQGPVSYVYAKAAQMLPGSMGVK